MCLLSLSIPYGTLFLHSFNDSLALSRSAGWLSMSRDLQILCRVMTRQPSLICSELPQASTCQCLPPASQSYCHHSKESGSRPQAETQPKLSTFPPVQSSQQSGLCCLSHAPSSLPQSSPEPRACHLLLLLLPSPTIAPFPPLLCSCPWPARSLLSC